MDQMDDPSLSLRPFPSFIEIFGIVACIVPFVISMSSSTSHTVNGQVTSFTYRDPIAIAGGIVGAVCGLIAAATLLRKTVPAKRMMRVLLCLALVGGGAFQTLRGFGIVGVGKPDISESTSFTITETPAPETSGKTDDAIPATEKIVALWGNNQLKELYESGQAEVRANLDVFDLQFVHDTMAESFGKLVRAVDLTVKTDGDEIKVEGEAVFEKEQLILKVIFVRVDGALQWRGLTIDIPKPLQREPQPADGDAFARKVLDQLLAANPDPALYHPRLVDKTPADIGEKLAALAKDLGPIKKIDPPVEVECKETRCLTFAITAKKKKAKFDIELRYMARSWRVMSWNIEPQK
jgi:hypothetical protein